VDVLLHFELVAVRGRGSARLVLPLVAVRGLTDETGTVLQVNRLLALNGVRRKLESERQRARVRRVTETVAAEELEDEFAVNDRQIEVRARDFRTRIGAANRGPDVVEIRLGDIKHVVVHGVDDLRFGEVL